MKKRISLLLICVIFCLCACAKKEKETPAEAAVTSEEATEKETEKETEAAETESEETAGAETEKQTETAEETTAETEAVTEEETEQETEAPEETEERSFAVLPDESILLSFSNESFYHPEDFPNLPVFGSVGEEDVSQLREGVSDMLALNPMDAGITPDYIYGDCTTQVLVPDEENGVRIMETYACTGNGLLDEVMQKEGYRDYTLDYFYPWLAWIPAGEVENKPVYADLYIDGNEYRYYFLNDELVCREGPDGESLNPETNDFMNRIYKIGCYYGNVINKERSRYSLFIYSPDQIGEKDGAFVITCGLQGREKEWKFVIDKDTIWSEDCETEYFSGYREGESAYEWYSRAYEALSKEEYTDDPEFEITALSGIFEVRTTGNHVDELCGCYWWD